MSQFDRVTKLYNNTFMWDNFFSLQKIFQTIWEK